LLFTRSIESTTTEPSASSGSPVPAKPWGAMPRAAHIRFPKYTHADTHGPRRPSHAPYTAIVADREPGEGARHRLTDGWRGPAAPTPAGLNDAPAPTGSVAARRSRSRACAPGLGPTTATCDMGTDEIVSGNCRRRRRHSLVIDQPQEPNQSINQSINQSTQEEAAVGMKEEGSSSSPTCLQRRRPLHNSIDRSRATERLWRPPTPDPHLLTRTDWPPSSPSSQPPTGPPRGRNERAAARHRTRGRNSNVAELAYVHGGERIGKQRALWGVHEGHTTAITRWTISSMEMVPN
jgi:hypothetical protein